MRYDSREERIALKALYDFYRKEYKEAGRVVRDTTEILVCTIPKEDCLISIQGRGCWFKDERGVDAKNVRCPYNDYHIKKHLITVSEALREKESEW